MVKSAYANFSQSHMNLEWRIETALYAKIPINNSNLREKKQTNLSSVAINYVRKRQMSLNSAIYCVKKKPTRLSPTANSEINKKNLQ